MTKDEFMAALTLLPTIGFRPILMGIRGDIRFIGGPPGLLVEPLIGCCPVVAVAILKGGPKVPNYSYPKAGEFLELDPDLAGDIARASDSNFQFGAQQAELLRKEMLELIGTPVELIP